MPSSGSTPFLRRCQSARWLGLIALFTQALFTASFAEQLAPVPLDSPGNYPPWWFEREVVKRIDPVKDTDPSWWYGSYPTREDYAVVNIGQLKKIATAAFDEMSIHLPGGPGPDVTALIKSWYQLEPINGQPASPTDPNSTFHLDQNQNRVPLVTVKTDDYAAINLGQLKNVAKLFYDRLIAVNFIANYPWTKGVANDFSAANLGQLKYLFSFNLTADTDGDGIPDWWELAAHLDPNDPSDAANQVANPNLTDAHALPLTNLGAYQAGYDPKSTFDPQNPPPPAVNNPLNSMDFVQFAVAPVSAQLTGDDVINLAINDNNDLAFTYYPSGDATQLAAAVYSQGQMGSPKTYPLDTRTKIISQTNDNNGDPQVVDYVYNVQRTYTGLSADGGMSGYDTYISTADDTHSDPHQSFLRAIIVDKNGDETEMWPSSGGNSVNDLGILAEWDAWAGLYYSAYCYLNVGSSGEMAGYFNAPRGPVTLYGVDSPQWLQISNPPGSVMYQPVVFSPSGASAGYVFYPDGNGPSSGGVCVGGVIQAMQTTILPQAVSDNGMVLAESPTTIDGSNGMCIFANGSVTLLSQLLPDQYRGRIRFPSRGVATPSINNNANVVLTADVYDGSDPLNPQWTRITLSWRNVFGSLAGGTSDLKFANIPSGLTLKQCNNNDVFSGIYSPPAEVINGTPQAQTSGAAIAARIRYIAKQGQFFFGFDPPMHGDYDPYYNHRSDDAAPYWYTSVTKTGTYSVNQQLQLQFDVDGPLPAGYRLRVGSNSGQKITVQPALITQKITDITITGLNDSSLPGPQLATVELVAPNGAVVPQATLKVELLPAVNLNLGVYFLNDPTSPLPGGLPTKEAIRDQLNQTFRPAGINFVLTGDSGTTTYHYDTELPHGLNSGTPPDPEYLALFQTANLFTGNLNILVGTQMQGAVPNEAGFCPVYVDPNSVTNGQRKIMVLASTILAAGRSVQQSAAHEGGHALGLSTRDGYDPVSKKPITTLWGQGHDLGLFPNAAYQESIGIIPGTEGVPMVGLMYPTQSGVDRTIWTRHEDWWKANETALKWAAGQ